VHERHDGDALPRAKLEGWWGARASDRFVMSEAHAPEAGAAAFALSNPPVLLVAVLRASLAAFDAAGGMAPLRAKSEVLTRYLAALVAARLPRVRVLTPADPAARGAQLSLELPAGAPLKALAARLAEEGVFVDTREPSVMRVAPAPLYNCARDVADFVDALAAAMAE